jgi:release factor glutamine methyltransferase
MNAADLLVPPRGTYAGPDAARFREWIEARARGVPLQHLVGRMEFHTIELRVEPGVFIPRPETELLVEHALAEIHDGACILDLCTGTGAIALAIARALLARNMSARVCAGDRDPYRHRSRPPQCTSFGARLHIDIRESDLAEAFADLTGQVDVLVANPPYIDPAFAGSLPFDVRFGDPPHALFDPEGGTGFHRRIADQDARCCAPAARCFSRLARTKVRAWRAFSRTSATWTCRSFPISPAAIASPEGGGRHRRHPRKGNGPLRGEVAISGSKNAALPILTAAILFQDPVSIDNVPELRDITTLLNLLSLLGVRSVRRGKRIVLDASGPLSHEAPYDLVRKMRASIYVLGPLLARLAKHVSLFPADVPGDRGQSICTSWRWRSSARKFRRPRLCRREIAAWRFEGRHDLFRNIERRRNVQCASGLRDREGRDHARERRDRARGGFARRILGGVRRTH